ncbi:MAG TPA: ERCC4 domain-containing protein [Chthoniobacterales bacterium]|nr:ERCC4 domain-containing protein [Chthoniobacterales bacterium]
MNNGFRLPALRGLGELADAEPIIVIDTREQDPLPFSRLATRRGTLITGDYSVAGLEGLFSVERKTVEDLTGCCIGGRERFERELHRLRGFRFRRLLIIGTEEMIWRCKYHSGITPKAVMATLCAFEIRYDLPVVFADTPEKAGTLVERWGFWFARETVETLNELSRSTPAKYFG